MKTSSVDQIILEVLSKEHAHLTALQIFTELRSRLPAINQSTVYRALERLVTLGKVSISDIGTGSIVYELLTDGLHDHLVCKNCGRMLTIDHDLAQIFFNSIQSKYQFSVITKHIILFGICEDCSSTMRISTNK